MTKGTCLAVLAISIALASSTPALAQPDLFSNQQRIEFTPDWHGERFSERPDVPDSIITRFMEISAGEAWDVFGDAIGSRAKKGRRLGAENSWIIDILRPGGGVVIDLFGKIRYQTIVGDRIDAKWTKPMIQKFNAWLEKKGSQLRMPVE